MSAGADAPQPPHPPHLIVSVTEIRRRLGSRLEVHSAIEAAGLALADVGVGVPDGSEVRLDGEVESIHDGVVLTAEATVPWVGECRRCLRPIDGIATLDLREVFETKPVDGETWPLDHDHIDIGPLLHDTALLALPLAPLCAEDCAGPAPGALPVVVEGDPAPDTDAPDGEAPRDPRWAALDDLDL
ncbi:MAG: hypothetical protein JWM89_2535 [Acidimicrobiales bacterium]|nr:hypothetical protein [Acidimicrobiales bacterium]